MQNYRPEVFSDPDYSVTCPREALMFLTDMLLREAMGFRDKGRPGYLDMIRHANLADIGLEAIRAFLPEGGPSPYRYVQQAVDRRLSASQLVDPEGGVPVQKFPDHVPTWTPEVPRPALSCPDAPFFPNEIRNEIDALAYLVELNLATLERLRADLAPQYINPAMKHSDPVQRFEMYCSVGMEHLAESFAGVEWTGCKRIQRWCAENSAEGAEMGQP